MKSDTISWNFEFGNVDWSIIEHSVGNVNCDPVEADTIYYSIVQRIRKHPPCKAKGWIKWINPFGTVSERTFKGEH